MNTRLRLRPPNFLRTFLSWLLAAVLLPAAAGLAHVESEGMPDAVAEMEYRIHLEFKPNHLPTLTGLGMVLYRLDRLAEAEGLFARALRRDPGHGAALAGMGLVKVGQGEDEAAVIYLGKAVAAGQDDYQVFYGLGTALARRGAPYQAAAAYRQALLRYQELHAADTAGHPDAGGRDETLEMLQTAVDNIETQLQEYR